MNSPAADLPACGKCGLTIHPPFTAHSEYRCIELLQAEIWRIKGSLPNLRQEIVALRRAVLNQCKALAEVREILTQSTIQCNYPTEDGELCDGEDCIYCAMLHSIDDAGLSG